MIQGASMRRVRSFWGIAGIALVGLAGCVTHAQPDLRPKQEDEYVLPPPGTYTTPGQYPKEYLNQVPGRKDGNPDDVKPVNPGMQRLGVGPTGPGR